MGFNSGFKGLSDAYLWVYFAGIFRVSFAAAVTDMLIASWFRMIFTKYVLSLHEDVFSCLALDPLCSPFGLLLSAAEINYFSSRNVSLVYFSVVV